MIEVGEALRLECLEILFASDDRGGGILGVSEDVFA